MALNKQTFITRTITALIFAAVMLFGLLWNHWSFFILFSIIHFGCWWEYLQLTEKIHRTNFHIYTKLGLMLMGYGIMLLFCGDTYQLNGFGIKNNLSLPISVAGFILLIAGIFKAHLLRTKAFAMAALGVLYISLSWGLMLDLYQNIIDIHIHDTVFVLSSGFISFIIVLSIWINDTMAYIVGSLIGKTPLSKVSPKKTWEGTIGGIVLSVLIIRVIILPLYATNINIITTTLSFFLIAIPLIASITGTFGDLLESKLKRLAGVKDSGSIMPGHGGFLDRFDSLLLATPFVWLFVKLLLEQG